MSPDGQPKHVAVCLLADATGVLRSVRQVPGHPLTWMATACVAVIAITGDLYGL